MRHQHQTIGIGRVINPIIVAVAQVSVPVVQLDLEGSQSDNPLDIKPLGNLFQPLRGILHLQGFAQCGEVSPIGDAFAGVPLEIGIQVLQETWVIKVSFGGAEVLLQEGLVPAPFEHINAQIASIDRHQGPGGSGSRNPGLDEHF